MTDAEKGRRFRVEADKQGLTLSTPDSFESRFTFHLTAGTIVTSRHTKLLTQLLKLAKEIWGEDGDYLELLYVTAPRVEVFPSIAAANVEWNQASGKDRIEFSQWLKDQFLSTEAAKLGGFPR